MLAELHNISKSYGKPGSEIFNPVLNEISLAIGEGESVAIVGPSGSGKSTLLNILGTLDKPTSGRVILDRIPVDGLDENQLAGYRNQFIGFVFQLHYLLPQLTLIENVLLPALPVRDKPTRNMTVDRAHQLIERAGLKKQIHRRPAQLSVGECQRAAVVRALVNQPRLLLADEPTGSLDAHHAGQIGQLLADLNRDHGLTVVVVTHSMELASRMGKIYRLTSGKLQLMTQL
jgi:lipoprotein-releasing system ATP-binding protein